MSKGTRPSKNNSNIIGNATPVATADAWIKLLDEKNLSFEELKETIINAKDYHSDKKSFEKEVYAFLTDSFVCDLLGNPEREELCKEATGLTIKELSEAEKVLNVEPANSITTKSPLKDEIVEEYIPEMFYPKTVEESFEGRENYDDFIKDIKDFSIARGINPSKKPAYLFDLYDKCEQMLFFGDIEDKFGKENAKRFESDVTDGKGFKVFVWKKLLGFANFSLEELEKKMLSDKEKETYDEYDFQVAVLNFLDEDLVKEKISEEDKNNLIQNVTGLTIEQLAEVVAESLEYVDYGEYIPTSFERRFIESKTYEEYVQSLIQLKENYEELILEYSTKDWNYYGEDYKELPYLIELYKSCKKLATTDEFKDKFGEENAKRFESDVTEGKGFDICIEEIEVALKERLDDLDTEVVLIDEEVYTPLDEEVDYNDIIEGLGMPFYSEYPGEKTDYMRELIEKLIDQTPFDELQETVEILTNKYQEDIENEEDLNEALDFYNAVAKYLEDAVENKYKEDSSKVEEIKEMFTGGRKLSEIIVDLNGKMGNYSDTAVDDLLKAMNFDEEEVDFEKEYNEILEKIGMPSFEERNTEQSGYRYMTVMLTKLKEEYSYEEFKKAVEVIASRHNNNINNNEKLKEAKEFYYVLDLGLHSIFDGNYNKVKEIKNMVVEGCSIGGVKSIADIRYEIGYRIIKASKVKTASKDTSEMPSTPIGKKETSSTEDKNEIEEHIVVDVSPEDKPEDVVEEPPVEDATEEIDEESKEDAPVTEEVPVVEEKPEDELGDETPTEEVVGEDDTTSEEETAEVVESEESAKVQYLKNEAIKKLKKLLKKPSKKDADVQEAGVTLIETVCDNTPEAEADWKDALAVVKAKDAKLAIGIEDVRDVYFKAIKLGGEMEEDKKTEEISDEEIVDDEVLPTDGVKDETKPSKIKPILKKAGAFGMVVVTIALFVLGIKTIISDIFNVPEGTNTGSSNKQEITTNDSSNDKGGASDNVVNPPVVEGNTNALTEEQRLALKDKLSIITTGNIDQTTIQLVGVVKDETTSIQDAYIKATETNRKGEAVEVLYKLGYSSETTKEDIKNGADILEVRPGVADAVKYVSATTFGDETFVGKVQEFAKSENPYINISVDKVEGTFNVEIVGEKDGKIYVANAQTQNRNGATTQTLIEEAMGNATQQESLMDAVVSQSARKLQSERTK